MVVLRMCYEQVLVPLKENYYEPFFLELNELQLIILKHLDLFYFY